MKIENFALTKLANASHLQFMADVDVVLSAVGFNGEIATEYSSFKTALSIEAESQKTEDGSAITKLIADADSLRDDRYDGFYFLVKGNTNHFDSEVAESARRIIRILDQFGNPTKLPYNNETSVLNSIIASLETTLSADIIQIGLSPWVANIKQLNTDFAKLFNDRRDEYAGRVIPAMKETRVLTDAAYKKMVERINALTIVHGEATYMDAIYKLNETITYFRNTLAIKDGKAKATGQTAASAVMEHSK